MSDNNNDTNAIASSEYFEPLILCDESEAEQLYNEISLLNNTDKTKIQQNSEQIIDSYLMQRVLPYIAQGIDNINRQQPYNPGEYLHRYLRAVGQELEKNATEEASRRYTQTLEESNNNFEKTLKNRWLLQITLLYMLHYYHYAQ